jgi:ElaB/YqjD/DUF883 family membrane-anchored ribosome-binding protein
MATTTSAENMFPSSSTATSSISAGTAGSGAVDNGTDSTTMTGTRAQSEMLNRVVQGAHHTIDKLAETAAPHVQRLEQGVASASESLHARADHAREVGDEWAESLRSTVRENPLAAVATALAVGLLIARLTR